MRNSNRRVPNLLLLGLGALRSLSQVLVKALGTSIYRRSALRRDR